MGFLFSADYVFNNVLEPQQQIRIKVVLGMEEDLAGAGYNVNQSKIAIGSGGLWLSLIHISIRSLTFTLC